MKHVFGQDDTPTILQALSKYPAGYGMTTLLKCPVLSDVKTLLGSPGSLTLFCPVTDAFCQAKQGAEMFGADMRPFFKDIVMCHAVDKSVTSKDFPCFVNNLCTDPNWVNRGGKGQIMQLMVDKCGLSVCYGIPGWPMWTARVYQSDITCSNGTLFFISQVMRFPYSMSSMCRLQGMGISFRYVLESVALGALTNCTTDITLFVPQSCAVDNLLKQAMAPDKVLETVKTHHVKGVYCSSDLKDGMTLETYNGMDLKVTVDKTGAVCVSGVRVLFTDVICKNGVVHIIEKVIIPDSSTATVTTVTDALESAFF